MPKPIYLWGDTPLIILGLENALKKEEYYVHNLINLEHSTTEPDSQFPFCLIIQLGKNHNDRIHYIRKFLQRFPEAKLLLISNEKDRKCIKAFFKAGINGFALPTIQPEILCKALRQLERDQAFIDPQISQEWTQSAIGLGSSAENLTRREKEVLQLIVEEFTTKEIAEKLYISQCTAETHRLNIIHKLGVRNTAGVVREAVRMGWYA